MYKYKKRESLRFGKYFLFFVCLFSGEESNENDWILNSMENECLLVEILQILLTVTWMFW